MILWRNARATFKSLLNLKFKYQQKLTKYLTQYNKIARFQTFLTIELQLENILFKAKLLPDANAVNLFIDNKLVFVNGACCQNSKYSIFVGDFIQLIVSLKYYILSRWFAHWSIQKKIRLKTKSKKKLNNQSVGDDKQRSNSLPHWILQNKNIINDASRYLEIDYFTLSAFFIYEPFLWNDVDPYSYLTIKFSIVNLYNWKYIT
jgi:ribosomal protein S4